MSSPGDRLIEHVQGRRSLESEEAGEIGEVVKLETGIARGEGGRREEVALDPLPILCRACGVHDEKDAVVAPVDDQIVLDPPPRCQHDRVAGLTGS